VLKEKRNYLGLGISISGCTLAFSSVVKSRSPLWFQFRDEMGLRCVLLSSSAWRSSAFQKDIAPVGTGRKIRGVGTFPRIIDSQPTVPPADG